MREIIIGIGDFQISNDTNSVLKTFALGSCVAVVIYDNQTHTGGMIHIALSNSKVNEEKSRSKPGYFANTGIPAIVNAFKKADSTFDPSKCTIKLIGGASVLNDEDFFNIGKTNIETTRRILKEYGFKIHKEDVGGKISRTVSLSIENGKVIISNAEIGKWEL